MPFFKTLKQTFGEDIRINVDDFIKHQNFILKFDHCH